jgi:hypothetical protein
VSVSVSEWEWVGVGVEWEWVSVSVSERYLPSTITAPHVPIASLFILSLLSGFQFSYVSVRPRFHAVSIRDSGEPQPSCSPSRHLCSSSRTPTVPSRSRLRVFAQAIWLALPSSVVLERVCWCIASYCTHSLDMCVSVVLILHSTIAFSILYTFSYCWQVIVSYKRAVSQKSHKVKIKRIKTKE